MSLKEQKKQIVLDLAKYCKGHPLTKCESKSGCTSCEIDWYRNRLATSEEKVKQLSEALKGYYEHSKNNHQVNGLNETAKELLNNKEI